MQRKAHIVASPEEGVALLRDLEFPVLIIPWGEESGAPQYVVLSSEMFETRLIAAFNDAMYQRAAHVIQLADLVSNPRHEATYKGTPS
jgi:hypothetical protein